ncbi:glycosyltransferase family 2 protein [Ancylobacter sp. 6x-1]|uniref:Glycosyltransferase family 2 protein n=1 Tax=Ancylobacter crimeensis TaxID=2579147 RepID=A0ABT0DER4_9HYPH|nr:glycosyltransferase family 2 protein [Ancylobacter crimeensis]MCK0198462.1 glycosyltransferase family 2 protein [Ancylobacter crimeensis]
MLASAPVGTVAAVCMCRDAADIILVLCGHYLRIGVARILVIDDGSSDGTHERLQRLARRTAGRVEVRRVLNSRNEQPTVMTEAINELIAQGYRLVIPFDSDEFWALTRADLVRLAARREPRLILARWRNFAQRRNQHYPTPAGLLHAYHAAPASAAADRIAIENLEAPFLHVQAPKIAVWTEDPVRILRGQHGLEDGPQVQDPEVFEILHLPLRSRAELTKRGLNYEVRRDPERPCGMSWQSRFHRRVVEEGLTDRVWAANSVDRGGHLDVYGRRVPLECDRRLQALVLRSALHLLLSWRISPF